MSISHTSLQNNSILSFKADKKADKRENQIDLKNMSDQDLYILANTPDQYFKNAAMYDESQKYLQSPMRKVEKRTADLYPVADTLITAALTPGDFGDKVFAAVDTALFWGVFLKMSHVLDKKLYENKKYREFAQNHPVISSLTSSAIITAVSIGGYLGIKLGVNKLFDKYKPAKNFINTVRSDLNNSLTGKRIAAFADRHRTGTAIAGLILFASLIGLAVNNMFSIAKTKRNADEKTEQYKNLRMEASRELNNRLMSRQAED